MNNYELLNKNEEICVVFGRKVIKKTFYKVFINEDATKSNQISANICLVMETSDVMRAPLLRPLALLNCG